MPRGLAERSQLLDCVTAATARVHALQSARYNRLSPASHPVLKPPLMRTNQPPARLSRRSFLQAAAAVAAAGTSISQPGWAAQLATERLIVRSGDPLNAEPELAELVKAATTPVERFYVRNHGPAPKVEAAHLKLRVDGMVEKSGEWSLAQLKDRFSKQSVEATLTCAGNRRQEISAIKPVAGVQWDAGAIGHARWSGVKLADLLAAAGIKENAKHVWFEGLDPIKEKDGSVAPFGGSIPLEKALAKDQPALLADSMNDQPLTPEHGFPLRTIVPGYIGARSVKWLKKIVVSDRPSPNHYVAEAYKLIQTESKDEVAKAEPIYAMPVNAAICTPAAGAKLKSGRVSIAGYALPSGEPGCTVAKVELSKDDGRTWTACQLQGASRTYSWQLWTAELDLPAGKHELIICATDTKGHMTPEKPTWNLKGYLCNAWHRVAVEVA
jgi:sulfite oxidase